jgi:hypothetical protein
MKLLNIKYCQALLILLLGLSMIQCRKDDINTQVIPTPLETYSNVSFLITVNGEDNELILNSKVELEGQTEQISSDNNGVIIVDNITIQQSGIKAEFFAEGYENQTVRLLGTPNVVTPISVKLVKLTTKFIDTGDEDVISGSCLLELPSTLEYANGDSYTGIVDVRSTYLDANNKNLISSTLGNMHALDSGGEYKLLGASDMLKIELYDEVGGQLFIPTGQVLTVKIPYHESQHKTTISRMKTWLLDEDLAMWSESGTVSLEDEMIVTEIGRAAWINFGIPYYFYQTRMSFRDMNNRDVPNLKVRLYAHNSLLNEFNVNGGNDQEVSLPLAEELHIEYNYGEDNFYQSLGSFVGLEHNVNVILEDITAYLVTCTAVNCEIENLQSGYGLLTQGEVSSAFGFKYGQFRYLNILEDHEVQFVDRESNQSVSFDINFFEDDISLGEIVICEEDLAKISGYVLLDSDEDGVGDAPLENHIVNLFSDSQDLQKSTDSDGYYEFTFLQTDSVFLQLELDQDQFVIYQSGDITPESMGEMLGYNIGYPIKNLSAIHDEDNNFILINQGDGVISGSYLGDSNGDGVGDVPLEWQVINTITENQIGYVNSNGQFSIERKNGHGELWTGFYAWIEDYDATPDPDGDDSGLGPNGKIPYFINSNEIDDDNNFVIELDFSAIVVQVLEDTNGDGIGDVAVDEGQVRIKHLTGGPGSVFSVIELSDGRYAIDEFGVSLAELHEVTLILPFSYEIISIEDLSPDNDPAPVGEVMNVRTLGAEWDGGNTFVIRRI